ncbi:MAG: O-antigen ligase family protein [Candidatus Krumholzibacteriia bacterium]
MSPPDRQTGYHYSPSSGVGGSQVGAAVAVIFGVLLGTMSWLLLGRAGLSTVMALLGVSVVGMVLSYISWQNMSLLVSIWLFTMSGFRAYAMIYMPFLPDISLERVLAVWILILFAMRLIMRRDQIRGPYTLDIILVLHTLYILANVTYIGNKVHAHEWAISSVSPLIGYFIGKNMMSRDKDVRFLYIVFFVILIYYYTQSIAQKFDIDVLIWPKAILNRYKGQWPAGRSRGPFLHPPLFGQMMAMFIPVQFYFFYRMKMRLGRFLVLISIGLSGLGLLYTYTRGPWLAGAIAVLVLGVMRPRYRQLMAALGVLLAVAGFIGVLQAAHSELLQSRFGDTMTIGNRLAAMSAALRMWRDNPLFGIGWFNWEAVYPFYHRGEHIPLFGYVTRHMGKGVVIHDIYWGRLAEEGLLSVGLLTAAVAITWFRFRYLWARVHSSDWLNRDGLAVVAAVFAAYAAGGLVIDFRYFDLVNVIPYLFMGILAGYQIPDHPPPPRPYRNWTPPRFMSSSDQADPTAGQV